jgi:hypothetical protein
MSRSIDLPDSVYTALEEAAVAAGTSPAEWIAAQLPDLAPAIEPEREGLPPRTLAERFEGRVGLIRSGRRDLSEHHGELIADGMVEKHRARQLSAHRETGSDRAVQLPASTFTALEEAARATGTTPEGWIAANLPPTLVASEDEENAPPGTLAERLAGLVGLIRSGRNDLAERHSELFMEGLLEKRRTGTL